MAALVAIDQRLPGGYLVAMGLRLDECIEAVEQVFTEHNLPMREQVIAELTVWQCLVRDGRQVMAHSERVLHAVIQAVRERKP